MRIPKEYAVDGIKSLMLSLSQIETRHRKTVGPIISTAGPITATVDETGQYTLADQEIGVLRVALDLRGKSRLALDKGIVPAPKKIADQFEKRE